MDYSQERIATLHDLTNPTPEAPLEAAAVVVPVAGDRIENVVANHVFETLEAIDPGLVVVPLRAPRAVANRFQQWIDGYEFSTQVLWCNSEAVEALLSNHDLDGDRGKGRDVWLGLGVAAAEADYVVVHDADTESYHESHVPRLLAPLAVDTAGVAPKRFVKAYYARVENGQLYGRLTRLFVAPLLRALRGQHDAEILEFLSAFRYPLAGEFAMTAEIARQVRAQRSWGLEIGILGEAYEIAGPRGTAQVDLGVYRHDHRPVVGESGLANMAQEVGAALFRVLEANGVEPSYGGLIEAYQDAADRLVSQYALDASFNDLAYDPTAERTQIEEYAATIGPPGPDTRLPAWEQVEFSPTELLAASDRALHGSSEISVE